MPSSKSCEKCIKELTRLINCVNDKMTHQLVGVQHLALLLLGHKRRDLTLRKGLAGTDVF